MMVDSYIKLKKNQVAYPSPQKQDRGVLVVVWHQHARRDINDLCSNGLGEIVGLKDLDFPLASSKQQQTKKGNVFWERGRRKKKKTATNLSNPMVQTRPVFPSQTTLAPLVPS